MKMLPVARQTIAHVLEHWVTTTPDALAYTFVERDSQNPSLTYGELWNRVARTAEAIQRHGAPGDRIVLLLPGGAEFVVGFLACMVARRTAVPTPPPRNDRSLERTKRIVTDSGASGLIISPGQKERFSDSFFERGGLEILELSESLWEEDGSVDFSIETKPTDVALLQYTSGSTSRPKGVVVRHENLCDNLEHLRVRFGYNPDSRLVSWLPIYHDMGLMGGMLAPFFAGVPGAIMSPQHFIMEPLSWLRAMSSFRGTVSGGPNFAYDICVTRIPDREVETLDLRNWTAALNGAEPIRASTLERFARKFEPAGFDPKAFLSCYGLAESTLLVSCTGLHDAPTVLSVNDAKLAAGHAEPSEEPGSRRIVSCGTAISGHEMLLIDPATGAEVPERTVGEIVVAGPSVCEHYWSLSAKTPTTDETLTKNEGSTPFLRTGDLGFRSEGQLYVTGRLKNTVIIRGMNLSCEGVEELAQGAHPDLYSCLTAALSVDDGEDERLVVLQETPDSAQRHAAQIAGNIREAVTAQHGVRIDDVVLVKTRSLPRTTSGKVRRAEAVRLYLDDSLDRL